MSSPKLIYSIYENRLQNRLKKENLPKHIGLIHDGHRRYARKEGLLSFEVSYKIGMTRLKECIAWCDDVGIDYITSWLLSRENLARPKEELEPYFEILNELFEDLLIDDVVDNFKIESKLVIAEGDYVFVTDVRFENEAKWITMNGGCLVNINREGVKPANHEEHRQSIRMRKYISYNIHWPTFGEDDIEQCDDHILPIMAHIVQTEPKFQEIL